jgi:hypothetical protein
MIELCDNAIDDDGDGFVDLNDSDCDCQVAEPISLIPNPSFEEKSCCPENRGSLHCAETWIQASEATTDYIHKCGWFGWEDLPVPVPLPDGEACIGFRNGRFGMNPNPNWKEYTGACLTSPLKAGVTYKFQFWLGFTNYQNSPPLNVVFYGSTDCDNLPFGQGNEEHGCPLNGEGWMTLDMIFAGGANNWTRQEFNVTPDEDIFAIAIGPDCYEQNLSDNPYYFLDDLVLADVKEFELVISPTTHPCSPDFGLMLPFRDNNRYQWYRDGIALVGETTAEIKTSREGSYQVRVIEENGAGICKITKPYFHKKPVSQVTVTKHICEGNSVMVHGRAVNKSGVFLDTFQTINLCDSIVETRVIMEHRAFVDLEAKIFQGETFQLGHKSFDQPTSESVLLQSSKGCDSTVNLDLSFYQVFIPNAISPNGDGLNDSFVIYGSSELVSIPYLALYNKWGDRIFEAEGIAPNDLVPLWQQNDQASDVYGYVVRLEMDDGKLHQLKGSFLLIR